MSKPAGAIEVLEASCKYQTWEDIEPKQAKEILDYIERLEHKIGELENAQLRWIPVSPALPPKHCYVAIKWHFNTMDESCSGYGISYLDDGEKKLITRDHDPNKIVTHYMMLPQDLFN